MDLGGFFGVGWGQEVAVMDVFAPIDSYCLMWFMRGIGRKGVGMKEEKVPEGIIVIGSELVVVPDALFKSIERDEGFGLGDLVSADHFFCLSVEFLGGC